MGDYKLEPFDISQFNPSGHSKTLHQNLCVPSTAQAYSLCIEYMKYWFLNEVFQQNPFKSVYIDGKNVFDDQRRLSSLELLKREKPALAVIPTFSWDFNNDGVDIYQFGTKMYRAMGLYRDSFYKDWEHQSFLAVEMETLFMEFAYRMRVETRPAQLDMFKYVNLAAKIGGTWTQCVDMDFHVPYDIILSLAMDAGFELIEPSPDNPLEYPRVKDVQAFLCHLNTHSAMPFLYKLRTINGRNEFFMRMHDMPIHIRPVSIDADDGDRDGMLNTAFNIELRTEVRFPAPKFYAYYTNNERPYRNVYSGWNQPNGIITVIYTFNEIKVPEVNKLGWNKYIETSYEDDIDKIGLPLLIDLKPLLGDKEIAQTVQNCLNQGISPAIFCDVLVINGGEIVNGYMDWDNLVYKCDTPARSQNSFIAIYLDLMYINNYLSCMYDDKDTRVQPTKVPESKEYVPNPISKKPKHNMVPKNNPVDDDPKGIS